MAGKHAAVKERKQFHKGVAAVGLFAAATFFVAGSIISRTPTQATALYSQTTQTYTAPEDRLSGDANRDNYTVTLKGLDGQAAAETLLSYHSYPVGWCLNAVWKAFGSPQPDVPGAYMLARNSWERTPESYRHYDSSPPKGAIVYFQNTANPSAAGHIAISMGNGYVVSTDQPTSGQIGIVSIQKVTQSWGGRTYLGWTNYFMGQLVLTA